MTVRQHSFYLEDDDWTALRHLCLDRGISVSAFIAQAAREAIAGPQNAVREIKEVKLMEVSVVKDPPHPSQTVTMSTATGGAATVPYNPVRAVPKPSAAKKAKVRA